MRIHVIGNKGVVGSATQKTLSMNKNHEVTGSDKDEQLPDKVDIYLVCVPEKIVPEVLEDMKYHNGFVVVRSTVRPDLVPNLFKSYGHFCINPEFLKAHTAFWDCYFPKGIVIGQCCDEDGDFVAEMWNFLNVPIYKVSPQNASMIKLASNVHAAMLITFWNYLKKVCDNQDVDINEISRILPDLDERISRYGTIAGSAYGGTCLPKDVKQLIDLCKDNMLDHQFLDEMERINSWYGELGIARGGL